MPRKPEPKEDKDLDSDIDKLKFYHAHTKNKKLKQAYYNLWYVLVVARHRKDRSTSEDF